MPALINTLLGHDLFFLKIVADAWGIDLNAPDAASARPLIINAMTNKELFEEVFQSLPENARDAILAIYDHDGHLPWPKFSRDFGEVRVMGVSRRDRERPDLKPANPAEVLWYRAIIGRAFLNFKNVPQEYAYLPDEIIELVQPFATAQKKDTVRQASPGEILFTKLTDSPILQDTCTLLAAIRKGIQHQSIPHLKFGQSQPFLLQLFQCANILHGDHHLNTEVARELLEAAKGKALLSLFSTWVSCSQSNELMLIPTLTFESQPQNNSTMARNFLMEKIAELESGQWWNIESFVNSIYQKEPEFLRLAGDYDSWYVKDAITGEYLRGFRYWQQIEGAYIRFMINGPLHWFGILDLAADQIASENCAFRLTDTGIALIDHQTPKTDLIIEEILQINPQGKINVPFGAPLAIRYQIARFCDWITPFTDSYQYQISAQSMLNAQEQGLKASHLISLLQKAIAHPVPIKVKTALENWEKNGKEVDIHRVVLLRVSNPQIIVSLQNSKQKKFIDEILTENLAIIHNGAAAKVAEALFELGYLSGWAMD